MPTVGCRTLWYSGEPHVGAFSNANTVSLSMYAFMYVYMCACMYK